MSSTASSNSSTRLQGSTRPQQYGLVNSEHKSILRQRPPTGEVLAVRKNGNQRHRRSASYQSTPTVSPFLSPASSFGQREPLPPLVLDPNATRNTISEGGGYDRRHNNNNFAVFNKLWEVASGKRPPHVPRTTQQHQLQQQQEHFSQIESPIYVPEETAGHFAQLAPRAGFLQKLGTTIPEFKRRFFVLQPGTHLYYFLSPNDTEPRGCFDLDGSQVEEVDHLPDGRYRFALQWEEHRIVLEARSKDVGQEWIRSLETERMSYVRAELQDLQRHNDLLRFRLSDLEQKVKDYQLIEEDRDAAVEDAARWREKFEQLDDALRLLTKQMRHPESAGDRADDGELYNDNKTGEIGGDDNLREQPNQSTGETEKTSEDDEASQEESQSVLNTSGRDTSLLDSVGEDEAVAQEVEIPGSNFSMLSNACQQLRDSLILANQEASSTANDLNDANERIVTLERRLGKAEKHLCKLWEENCSIRTALKQKKQEKKILVREYKAMAVAKSALQSGNGMVTNNKGRLVANHDSKPASSLDISLDESSVMTGSEEDRLINEIEESVVATIRINQQFFGAGRSLSKEFEGTAKVSQTLSNGSSLLNGIDRSADKNTAATHASNPSQNKLSSLFDDSEDSDDQSSTAPSLVSSVGADYGEGNGTTINYENGQGNQAPQQDLEERPNPLLQLDGGDDDDYDNDDGETSSRPNLCAVSSQSESASSKSLITDNGRATARLVCPLADVVPTQNSDGTHDNSESVQDGQMYHLTFYTRKIGIQFQKVPPPNSAPHGLLTEAMTVELGADPADGFKTAAELRSVAEIGSDTTTTNMDNETCKVAAPVDAVLVCGLVGFDDTANRIRPKLGARLVAFDGISVEVGRWTFDSIRKAIQARNRPLTLSFRNDFLTTEQRSILTKAIAEERNPADPPPRTAINCIIHSRPSSTDPSVHSALSHESDYFVNQGDAGGGGGGGGGSSSTLRSSHHLNNYNDDASSSAASDISFAPPISRASSSSFSATRRHHTPGGGNFRSFSEAGSSSVLSSAFAPLMANLMAGLGSTSDATKTRQSFSNFTPEYLKRETGSLDNTPQHHDFKSNLL